MATASALLTTTGHDHPLDGSQGDTSKAGVSEFLTVQSLTNFAAMTGALTLAWNGLKLLTGWTSLWLPFILAGLWGVVSIMLSVEGLTAKGDKRPTVATYAAAILIALLNSIVLGSAVVGATVATGGAVVAGAKIP